MKQKLIIEINGSLRKGDMLFFDGKDLKPIQKETLLDDIYRTLLVLKSEITELQTRNESFKVQVNDKLKTYHDILKNLTKGE